MRVVSLSPSLTEILVAIGAEDCLAGVTDHCPELPQAARLGSPKALNIPGIESLNPEIIFSDQDNRPEEIRKFEKKFKIISFQVYSVQAVMDAAAAMGRAVQKNQEAGELNLRIKGEYDRVRQEAKDHAPVRTQILLWNTPLLTVNFDTYASKLIESCGGWNVFHEDPVREIPIDLEDMIEKNPELLLLPKTPFPFQKRHIARFRELRIFSRIPIELIDGRYFSLYGPKTIEALKGLSSIIVKARESREIPKPA